jgi:hypothetical protein
MYCRFEATTVELQLLKPGDKHSLKGFERNGDVSPTIVPATGTMGAGKTSVLGQSKRNHLK